ncbi:MAG TPA: DUF1329 domain-containing protein [Candidatus Binataceae bacterium]|nr:DUF1329 domain-containing protein [Candidatus Binataceae bacterium]
MKRFFTSVTVLVVVVLLAGAAPAQQSQQVPVGTVITKANCQKFLANMGEVFGHLCTSSDIQTSLPVNYQIVIAPTQSYPLPPTYWEATEKYGHQVKLVPTGDGGYRMIGYVAGQPFPFSTLSTKDPLAGFKLMYDSYFQYQPAMLVYHGLQAVLFDRYGNEFTQQAMGVLYNLGHVTDQGYPLVIPNSAGSKGVFTSGYTELIYPTQLQYIGGLELDYSNPDRFPLNYAFIPSIRRVVQLSQAARCAPFVANVDFSYDDVSKAPLPITWFKAQYLGTKNIISYIVPPDRVGVVNDPSMWDIHYGVWPKAAVGGHWEMRQQMQLAVQRIPKRAAGYCYANHYIWLDKEQTVTVGWDDFDQNGKFWRGLWTYQPAKRVPGWPNAYYLEGNAWCHLNYDFNNLHSDSLIPPKDGYWYNQDTPAKYVNYPRYSDVAGLNQIVQ